MCWISWGFRDVLTFSAWRKLLSQLEENLTSWSVWGFCFLLSVFPIPILLVLGSVSQKTNSTTTTVLVQRKLVSKSAQLVFVKKKKCKCKWLTIFKLTIPFSRGDAQPPSYSRGPPHLSQCLESVIAYYRLGCKPHPPLNAGIVVRNEGILWLHEMLHITPNPQLKRRQRKYKPLL